MQRCHIVKVSGIHVRGALAYEKRYQIVEAVACSIMQLPLSCEGRLDLICQETVGPYIQSRTARCGLLGSNRRFMVSWHLTYFRILYPIGVRWTTLAWTAPGHPQGRSPVSRP